MALVTIGGGREQIDLLADESSISHAVESCTDVDVLRLGPFEVDMFVEMDRDV